MTKQELMDKLDAVTDEAMNVQWKIDSLPEDEQEAAWTKLHANCEHERCIVCQRFDLTVELLAGILGGQ